MQAYYSPSYTALRGRRRVTIWASDVHDFFVKDSGPQEVQPQGGFCEGPYDGSDSQAHVAPSTWHIGHTVPTMDYMTCFSCPIHRTDRPSYSRIIEKHG